MSLVLAVLAGGSIPAAAAGYSDVPSSHWAATAVRYTALDREWMATGASAFRPGDDMPRREWARSLVKAFSPAEAADPATTFWDITPDDPDFTFAAIAVKHGWLSAANGYFKPDIGVTKRSMDRSLVLKLGLSAERTALNKIAASTTALKHDAYFSYQIIASQLRLHYNYPTGNEQSELLPTTVVSRADGAYALWRTATVPGTWVMNEVARYRSLRLPAMTTTQRTAIEFAFRYAGYPYVYAGEWFRATPDGYCCGAQRQGGFDCSGWAWWVMRSGSAGWDNTSFRPYSGWSLTQRASRDMAKAATTKIALTKLKPLDLVFFDTDSSSSDGTSWSSVDHAGIALGGGWMIHSSGGRGGVSIDWIADGWWRGHYRWGRRIAA